MSTISNENTRPAPRSSGQRGPAEYRVKIGFWLCAYDSLAVEAANDAEAIEKARTAAKDAMQLDAHPEHIDFDERREGIIVFIDRVSVDGPNESVAEDVEFDDDRIHGDAT
jgi:hypothetical protein